MNSKYREKLNNQVGTPKCALYSGEFTPRNNARRHLKGVCAPAGGSQTFLPICLYQVHTPPI